MYQNNTAFIAGTKLQWAFDSVSLGALKLCPRYYELSIVEGWEPRTRSHDLAFGIWLHEGREHYYRSRANKVGHDDALNEALEYILVATFDFELGRPWTTSSPNKNRATLARTLVWYLDQWQDDPLEQIMLANGAPAVELSFKFETDYIVRATGQPFVLAGHLDRLVRFNDSIWVSDLKSTKSTLGADYFAQFSPDNQFSLYALASKLVYAMPAKGIIIDAAQVAVTFSRFAREQVARSSDQLSEWYADLGEWFEVAQMYASRNHWPMNDKACFRCSFRQICSKPASVRAQWLAADYTKRTWNPLIARGDI